MKFMMVVLVGVFLVGCGVDNTPEPQEIKKKTEVVIQEKIVYKDRIIKEKCLENDMNIISAVELVQVVAVKATKKARIDTGATTTSIDAQNIVMFERDGKKWVKFTFAGKKIEKPMLGIVKIKRHGEEATKRPSIMIKLALGSVSKNVKVTLADRSKFIHPILIGRNFLKDTFIVDVGKKMGPAPKIKGKK